MTTFLSSASGIHFDFPTADYFADPCERPSLTQSIAKILLEKSPRHAWIAHPRLNPHYAEESTDYREELAIGNAAHALVLGRGKKVIRVKHDNFRTKEAREEKARIVADGNIPILEHHNVRAEEMATSARAQLIERGIEMAQFKTEVVLVAQVRNTWVRSMVDGLSFDRRVVFDYKTGGMNIAPDAIARKMVNDGVHIQAAFHEMILNTIDPENAGKRQHVFAFHENDEPYALNAFALTEEWMTMGRKAVGRAFSIWFDCLAHNKWPMYPTPGECPEFPSWEMKTALDRELRDEERKGAGPMLTELWGG